MDRPELPDPDLDVLALGLAHLLARLEWERGPVTILYDDQRLVLEGESDVLVDERTQRLVRRSGSTHPATTLGQQLVADADQHLGQHRVLGPEVPVDRGTGEATRSTQLGDGDAVEALLREQLGRDGQDLLSTLAHPHRIVTKVNDR